MRNIFKKCLEKSSGELAFAILFDGSEECFKQIYDKITSAHINSTMYHDSFNKRIYDNIVLKSYVKNIHNTLYTVAYRNSYIIINSKDEVYALDKLEFNKKFELDDEERL
jgi:hypothetical protein